jgi:hypothetical protein
VVAGPLTRRALAVGTAGALASALTACGPPSDAKIDAESRHEATDDVEILAGARDVIDEAIAAYGAALPRLAGNTRALATRMLEQERTHAAIVTRLLAQTGPTHPGAAGRSAPAPAPLSPRTSRAALGLLVAAEQRTIGYWIDALPKLSSGLRAVPAQMVTNDAEHLALLRGALGVRALPDPLVEGT